MKTKGPWERREIANFLEQSRIPLRLACNGAHGHPLMASLWFVPEGGSLWCATPRDSSLVARIESDPRCSFEVSTETPPYRGVRGSALARIRADRGEEVLRTLLARFVGDGDSKLRRILLSRVEREVAIEIQPRSLLSWDFGERMKDVVAPPA